MAGHCSRAADSSPAQHVQHRAVRDIGDDPRRARAVPQYETQATRLRFFVQPHARKQGFGFKTGGQCNRQAKAREQRVQALAVGVRRQAERSRQARRQHHPDRDCFPMIEAAIALLALDRMGEGVAEIEQRALAPFKRVALDDGRLVRAATGDRFGERGIIAGEQGIGMDLEPVEDRFACSRSDRPERLFAPKPS